MLDLSTITGLFYGSLDALGRFDPIDAAEMPDPYRRLLAHNNHMTVTVEAYHGSSVDVRVLEKQVTDRHYARKILLARQADGVVVQFGIMRIRFAGLGQEVREEIERESLPLGRILITHNVLRQVELMGLWRIQPADELRGLLNLDSGQITFGRTAIIQLDGEAAVELLEIVTSVEEPCSNRTTVS